MGHRWFDHRNVRSKRVEDAPLLDQVIHDGGTGDQGPSPPSLTQPTTCPTAEGNADSVQGQADAQERALLARCAQGDQSALRDLLDRYRPRLWGYLWHQAGEDRDRAEDLLQEVCIAIWQHAASFRGEARVATWIFRLAHNRALNARRDRDRRPEGHQVILLDDEDQQLTVPHNEDLHIARLDLGTALRRLPERQREVIALLFVAGFTMAEAATVLHIPLGTVKSRLAQAREALRAAFQGDHPVALGEEHPHA